LENSDETIKYDADTSALGGAVIKGGIASLSNGLANGIAGAIRGARQQAPQVYDKAATDKLIADLKQRIDVASAVAAGREDQREALKEALAKFDPKHPLLQNTAYKFKDGQAKSKLRLIFEASFDKYLRTKGYLYPPSLRVD
jgi:hypothetical protein